MNCQGCRLVATGGSLWSNESWPQYVASNRSTASAVRLTFSGDRPLASFRYQCASSTSVDTCGSAECFDRTRYLLQIGPGRGGPIIGNLGDTLLRVKMPDGKESLNDPRILPAVLHLYALGCHDYMLYGVERWIARKNNVPAFRKKIGELRGEIGRLRRERPQGRQDLSRRYEDAVNGLSNLADKSENASN